MRFATFLIVFPAVSLLACGKPEGTPVPSAEAAPAMRPMTAAPLAAANTLLTTKPASEAASGEPDFAHGQQIYLQTCAFCHEKGIAGAPKTGDRAAWSPRLAQGKETLYASALLGKNAMPAKGGNPALQDADVKAAVDYLAAQSH